MNSTVVVEVRNDGSDNNAGYFDPGIAGAGTDCTQQPTPFYSYTDLRAVGAVNIVTSTNRPFTAADVGNSLRIPAGVTGWTAGLYMINSVAANNATLSGNAATSSGSTAGTAAFGGALQSILKAIGSTSELTDGGTVWVRQHTTSAYGPQDLTMKTLTTAFNKPIKVIGYGTVRGDGTRVNLQPGSAETWGIQLVNKFTTFRNFDFNANSLTSTGCFNVSSGADNSTFINIKVRNAVGAPGFYINAQYTRFIRCEATVCQDGFFFFVGGSALGAYFERCMAYANTRDGFSFGFNAYPTFLYCLSRNNGRAGVYVKSNSLWAQFNVFDANVYGIYLDNSGGDTGKGLVLNGNMVTYNTTSGIYSSTTDLSTPSTVAAFETENVRANGFYGNAADRTRFPVGVNDVLLTSPPYLNHASYDYHLTSDASAALTAASEYPGLLPDGINGPIIAAGINGSTATGAAADPAIADFDEVRLDTTISRGAVGGPAFKTTVVVTGSGAEQRNAAWSTPIYSWQFSFEAKTAADMSAVIAFFVARQGKARGFRFKDWSDYNCILEPSQLLSATTFQIVKTYTSGGVSRIRKIKKPVAGTITVYDAGGAVVNPAGYTVDTTTGIITFTFVPSYLPKVTCQFDVPVRFDADEMEIEHIDVDIKAWNNAKVVELRY